MTSYISLKQLLNNIQHQLRLSYPGSYWVKAEVAGVRRSGNHVYFDLLELEKGAKVAQIRGTAFWGEGTQVITAFEKQTGQKFTDGIKIGARVAVNF
ncbi:MAG TPA: exodeoxyribonuclease VII large subunit, partial [Sphingobacteriaceae bacterium]